MRFERHWFPRLFLLAFGLVAALGGAPALADTAPRRVSDMPTTPTAIAPTGDAAAPAAIPTNDATAIDHRAMADVNGAGSNLGSLPRAPMAPSETAWELTERARREALASPRAQLPAGTGLFGTGSAPPAENPRFGTTAVPHTMLYVVADVDDAAYRAAIAGFTGGAVDYFDGTAGTPSAATLAGYDCVYVHPNALFADPALLGDRLADYVDAGGKVILGLACTYDFGGLPRLQGRIMDPGYNPVVSPALSIDFSGDIYANDGVTDYFAGILTLVLNFQDEVVLQGPGVADGTYAGGEIMLAYRPDGQVVYVNGTGHASFAGAGDWAKIVANACWLKGPDSGSILFAAATGGDDFVFRSDVAAVGGSVVDYFDAVAGTPDPALLDTYDCVFTHSGNVYSDPLLMGDRLADFVDGGGKVILGVGTALPGFNLAGRIMTPDYSPVFNPAGTLHPGGPITDLGDGMGPLYSGVGGFTANFWEFLAVQGAGKVTGHYVDGEIASAQRPDGRVVFLNGAGAAGFGTGDWPQLVHNACARDLSSGHRILYAPSNVDDPALRAEIAAQTGGTVDYFNAITATPSAALLSSYDCVFTWAASAYDDMVLFGDRLADYVDGGGKVILGQFCTYTLGNELSGRIMTPGYSPVVSPTGNFTNLATNYAGDGTTCLHHRVLNYSPVFHDLLAVQGDGIVDARFADGEIAVAYRPDRRVVYLSGAGGDYAKGTGHWPILIANACECEIGPGQLYASSNQGGLGSLFNLDLLTGHGYLVGALPAGATELEHDPASGRTWIQHLDGVFAAQEITLANGSAAGPAIPNGASFNAMEYALGRMWAGWIGSPCAAADFGTLDPAAGTSAAVFAAAWARPISGLAFDYDTSTMYGVSGCGSSGPSELFTIDVTNGTILSVVGTPVRFGSLQFGPDGDLYGGGDNGDGGNLYRIHPGTGVVDLIGPTGFNSVTGLTLVPNNAVAAEPVVTGELALAAPFPNPSRAHLVRLDFTLPKAGRASLELYDVAGRKVWSRDMGSLPAGQHSAEWNGFTTSGRRVASGVYFVRLRTDVGEKRVSLVRLQ